MAVNDSLAAGADSPDSGIELEPTAAPDQQAAAIEGQGAESEQQAEPAHMERQHTKLGQALGRMEAGLENAIHSIPGDPMSWTQSIQYCSTEAEARKMADDLPVVYWGPIAKLGALGPDPCWWPWPKADQRVMLSSCCEESIREKDADGKEDPLNHHGLGCWWFSRIVFGADPATIVDLEKAGHMQPVIDKFGWKLPPFGLERNYNPWKDVPECGQGLQLQAWLT